jgi:hypothetical protein
MESWFQFKPLLSNGSTCAAYTLVFGTAILASAVSMVGAYLVYRNRPSHDRGLLVGCMTGVNLGRVGTPHPVILLAVRLVHSLCL